MFWFALTAKTYTLSKRNRPISHCQRQNRFLVRTRKLCCLSFDERDGIEVVFGFANITTVAHVGRLACQRILTTT